MAKRYEWEHVLSSSIDGDIDIILERYETLEDLLCEMYQSSLEDLQQSTHGGCDGNGKEWEFTFEELLETIKKMGCYGFADAKQKIHFWVNIETVDPLDFIGMMAHEKGHLTRPFHKNDLKEEFKAERYADAASFAFQIYSDVFGKHTQNITRSNEGDARCCPKCGCQIYDPFGRGAVVHDVESCAGRGE